MKIAFDISDLATGRADGTTRYTNEIAQRLPKLASDHNWNYLAPRIPASLVSCQLPNVTCQESPWPKYWTQLRLPFELMRFKPDVLLMPIQQIPYFRPNNFRTVAVVHDLAVHKYPEQFTYKDWVLLHIFSAYVAREADQIIAVSQATADDIRRYYGRVKNVHVIHHGLDHTQFREPSLEERATSWARLNTQYRSLRRPYILFIGQIQPRKNITRLVSAFEQVSVKRPDLQLVIAGSHGWLQKPILEAVRTSRAPLKILLLGRVSDNLLPALYWNAELFVLPSLYEGFGLPVLEAMACGCPVVTSNVSSLPEIAGSAAIFIDPQDVDSIKDGIIQAMEKPKDLVSLGLKRAKQFNWGKTARQTLDVILGGI